MKTYTLPIAGLLLIFIIAPLNSFAQTTKKDMGLKIDVNKEDRDVGLKRMELIDKSLSRDLMERKRDMVKNLEHDYNQKIAGLIDKIIPPIFENTVTTHIDVNYFATDFDSEVRASQKVSVALIIKKDGFNTWVDQNPSREAAEETLKQLISRTFKIDEGNISLLVLN